MWSTKPIVVEVLLDGVDELPNPDGSALFRRATRVAHSVGRRYFVMSAQMGNHFLPGAFGGHSEPV